jgi:hypothetical protein
MEPDTQPKRGPGRPVTVGREAREARQRILWRARNRALSLLSQRHPEEFNQLKDEVLVKWGHDPINPDNQRPDYIVGENTPLDDPIIRQKKEK